METIELVTLDGAATVLPSRAAERRETVCCCICGQVLSAPGARGGRPRVTCSPACRLKRDQTMRAIRWREQAIVLWRDSVEEIAPEMIAVLELEIAARRRTLHGTREDDEVPEREADDPELLVVASAR